MTVFGPVLGRQKDVPFQGLTALDEAVERTLLECDYRDLIEFLQTRTRVCGTDTFYTAVQLVGKEFTQAEILKWLSREKPKRPKVPLSRSSDNPVGTAKGSKGIDPLPGGEKPLQGSNSGSTAPRKPARVDSNAHPQEVINAKTAIIKAAGGSIKFDRSQKGWVVEVPGKVAQLWTSAEFREMSEDVIKEKVK